MSDSTHVLQTLYETIVDRKSASPDSSYTAKLLTSGVERIAAKITEEAAEVNEAAGEPGDEGQRHLTCEAADLVYHLLVMLASRDVTLADVEAELARRFGVSGLDEKASRGK